MKILFLEWKSFGNEDMADAFVQNGDTVKKFPFTNKIDRIDPEMEGKLCEAIRDFTPDALFSFNYFPLVSILCKELGIPYLSWIYDSPYVQLYSYTVINPCNHIFVFDKELCLEFNRAGIHTVHYLPLAANTKRLDAMQEDAAFLASPYAPRANISFIGSLYTEKHQFFQRLTNITDYTKGYLEGIISAQRQVYGYNFIQEVLPPDIIKDMQNSLPLEPNADGVETTEYLFAQYVINRQITAIERQRIISTLSAAHGLDLYTHDPQYSLDGLHNHGPADYYDVAPYAFRHSRINLNISLRSIKSGVPLRAFDILGAGGFLISNYQSDFMDILTPGDDMILYESENDLYEKVAYYLKHEDERAEIAGHGHDTIAAYHTYLHRVKEMKTYLS